VIAPKTLTKGTNLIHRFLRLPLADKSLVIRSLVLLYGVRVALWIAPIRVLRKALGKRKRHVRTAVDPTTIGKVAWAVRASSRYVPSATCLTQAFATLLLLDRLGQSADLRIGVARGEEGEFKAHAWVEADGSVVIGGTADLSSYAMFPRLG
jgi:hypothetical protein